MPSRTARGAILGLLPLFLLVSTIRPAVPQSSLVAVDAAVSAGIYEFTDSWSAPVGDYDRDGWQDVFLVRHQIAPRLYRNHGAGFTESTLQSWPLSDRHDCVWGDVNLDGLDDLYCSLGGEHGTGYVPNELWIHQSDHTFVERAAAWGVEDPYGRGRRVTFIDVNGDPYPDLFVGNQFPRSDGNVSRNRLFMNEAGVTFRSAPEYGVDLEVGGRCAVAADYDRDGWQDLFVCGQDSFRVYRNQQGSFADVTSSLGLSGRANMVALQDLDGDQDPDLIVARQNSLFVKPFEGGRFGTTTFSYPLMQGNYLAIGDVDRNGLTDIYVVQGCTNGTNVADVMLVGSDQAFGFATLPIPQTSEGCGDHVSAIDYDRNGTKDFIVLNAGASSDGPVQLISFTDASPSPSPTETPTPTPTPSPSPPPANTPTAATLGSFDSTSNTSAYSAGTVNVPADRVVVAVVASQSTTANSRIPTVSGLGASWSYEGGRVEALTSRTRLRLDVFRTTVAAPVSGSVGASFGANQTDVHIHVLGMAATGSVGPATWSTGTGTSGSLALAGSDPSRTLLTIVHAADEPSTPGAGLTELGDTDHGARPSGMATAWGATGFVGVPGMSWATSSRWIGVAMGIAPAA